MNINNPILFNKLTIKIVIFIDYLIEKLRNYFNYCRIKHVIGDNNNNLIFDKTTKFKYIKNIKFGRNISIGPNVIIGAKNTIELGDYVRISQNVIIETAGLDINGPIPYKHKAKPIVLQRGCWIGSGSIILGGVTIGEGSIIGAGSIVYKDVPPNSVIVPATMQHLKNLEERIYLN